MTFIISLFWEPKEAVNQKAFSVLKEGPFKKIERNTQFLSGLCRFQVPVLSSRREDGDFYLHKGCVQETALRLASLAQIS